MHRFGKDFWLGAGLLALSLFVLLYLIPAEVGPLGSAAALLPVVASAVLASLAVLLMLSRTAAPERTEPTGAGGRENGDCDEGGAGGARLRSRLAIVVVMVAYAWLLDWTGFLLASLVALVALLVILGVRRPTLVFGLPVAVVAAIYVGFEILLKAPLPEGLLLTDFL